jgi:hypothetical protein
MWVRGLLFMTNSIIRNRIIAALLGAVEMSAILIIVLAFLHLDSGTLFDPLFFFIFMIFLPVAAGIGIFLGIKSVRYTSPLAFARPLQVIVCVIAAFILLGFNGLFQEIGLIPKPGPLTDLFVTASSDYLIKSLGDPLPENKVRAAQELLQRKYPSTGDLLLPLLQDESIFVRGAVTRIFGELRDKRAVDRIIDLLDDPDYGMQLEAIRGLGEIGDGRAVEPLLAVLNRLNCSGVVAEALAKIGEQRAVGPLIGFLEEAKREDQIRFRKWVIQSLEKLSGQRFGDDLVCWRNWYLAEGKK